jgi:hypothetical protein
MVATTVEPVEPRRMPQMSMLALVHPAVAPAVLRPPSVGTAFDRSSAGRLLAGVSMGLNVALCALAIVALLA